MKYDPQGPVTPKTCLLSLVQTGEETQPRANIIPPYQTARHTEETDEKKMDYSMVFF